MPTLLVDATTLTANPKGVGKYAYEVITRLDRLLPASWTITLIIFRGAVPELNRTHRLSMIDIDWQSDLKLGLQTVPKLIRQSQPDLLLRLCDCVGCNYSVPVLTVCHDINELITRAQSVDLSMPRRLIYGLKEYFRIRALRASSVVVCNSEFTRQQAVSRYGITDQSSLIGYCGISDNFYVTSKDDAVSRIRNAYGFENYLLCFATGDPRENYGILPEVIAATKRKRLQKQYVIAGVRDGQAYAQELRIRLDEHSLIEGTDYVFVPFLGASDRQRLCDIYAAADFYLELSLHEGFGMQLAEAMACGTHCLSPNHSALSEVGGSFVVHIDPVDAEAVADSIFAAYVQQLHLQDHSEQIAYTRKFSWDKTATVIVEQVIKLGEMPR